MDDVLTLISTTQEKDKYGVIREKPEKREIFCQVLSITRSEFFNAGRNGLNPEFEFVIFVGDYQGEKLCAYRGQKYSIYRVFQPAGEDYIELYAQRKGGSNGKEQNADNV